MVGVLIFRIWQADKAKNIPFLSKKSSFSLQPPSEALTGRLIEAVGEVKKEPREDEEFKETEKGEQILDGEKLATGGKSKTVVEFPNFAKVSLASNSEVAFVSLLPSSFVVSQSLGSVTYELLQDDNPISVRSLHALLSFNSGESEVTVKEEEIIVKVSSGQAKLALVDLENKTHVWQLEKGQKALIDDRQRRVEIK